MRNTHKEHQHHLKRIIRSSLIYGAKQMFGFMRIHEWSAITCIAAANHLVANFLLIELDLSDYYSVREMKYTLVVLLCCMRTTVNGNKAQSVAQSVAETVIKSILKYYSQFLIHSRFSLASVSASRVDVQRLLMMIINVCKFLQRITRTSKCAMVHIYSIGSVARSHVRLSLIQFRWQFS